LHGQPLNIWLSAHTDLPLVGPYLGLPAVAIAASWAGFLHDLLIVPLLSFRRTRVWAYGGLLFFHVTTSTWFNIGIFPVLMPMAATLFFEPDWPLRLAARVRRAGRLTSSAGAEAAADTRAPRAQQGGFGNALGRRGLVCVLCAYAAVQGLAPLRNHLYGGNVLWHEQGMRWSWRVMLRDKHGAISYRVRLASGREVVVPPRRYLTGEQEREMSSQPDLILQLAHRIAQDFMRAGQPGVEVFVDAFVSLNGRPPERMIDPTIDLARVPDSVWPVGFVTTAPSNAPIRLAPRARYASAGS
jgi:hypothetical protein